MTAVKLLQRNFQIEILSSNSVEIRIKIVCVARSVLEKPSLHH